MGRHLAERKKLTVFDLRYYRYLLLILYIRGKKFLVLYSNLVKERLNRG